MITRLIAKTITPIVSKSGFLKLSEARGVISNRPYWDYQAPTRHGCHTTLIVKQNAKGFPLYRRAHVGYLHIDFKAKTRKQALQKIKSFLQLRCVGQFTTWGYGELQWIAHHSYVPHSSQYPRGPRFRILKGLPPTLSP